MWPRAGMGAPASGSPGFIARRPELRPLLRGATGRVSPPASAPRPPAPSPLPLPSPQPRTAGRRPSAAPRLQASGAPGAGPGHASPSAGPPLPPKPKPQPQLWPPCPLLCRKGNGHDWATKEQSTPGPAPPRGTKFHGDGARWAGGWSAVRRCDPQAAGLQRPPTAEPGSPAPAPSVLPGGARGRALPGHPGLRFPLLFFPISSTKEAAADTRPLQSCLYFFSHIENFSGYEVQDKSHKLSKVCPKIRWPTLSFKRKKTKNNKPLTKFHSSILTEGVNSP